MTLFNSGESFFIITVIITVYVQLYNTTIIGMLLLNMYLPFIPDFNLLNCIDLSMSDVTIIIH